MMMAFVREVNSTGLECTMDCLFQQGSEAKASARVRTSFLMTFCALTDLLLRFVKKTTTVAGIRDNCDPTAVSNFVYKLPEIII